MVAPLDGVTVLDFSRLLPGPFATQLLANLGADVIKVEDPAIGDYMRAVPPIVGGVSLPFLMVNRGKRSVAVDLKTAEGREVVRRLAARADVLLEQFRPGVMARLGADYATLSNINPRLIYCSFSGYGQHGPSKDMPGHDITFEAHAGILGVAGGRDDEPAVPGVPIADLASGFNAAVAILASLRTRDRTGRGEFIDVSIFDTAVTLMILNLAHYFGTGEEPSPGETILTGVFPFYDLYDAKDGRWLAVGAVEPKFWGRLCEVLGLEPFSEEQLVDDDTRIEIMDALSTAFASRTARDWAAIFEREGLPVALVRTVAEVAEDPDVGARGLLHPIRLPGGRTTKVLRHPAFHGEAEIRTPEAAPARGEHTGTVLESLGYAREDIEGLRRRGVIGG